MVAGPTSRNLDDAKTFFQQNQHRPGNRGPGESLAGRSASRWRLARATPFPAKSQARNLPVSIGRAVADGAVRSQAEAQGSARNRASRVDPAGAAPHRHDCHADELSRSAFALPVRAAWK